MSKFFCGTKETLGSGAKVKEVMRDFHRKNYVASAMTACINSTKSLDELENLALNQFATLLQGDRKTYQNTTDEFEPIEWRNCDKRIVLQGVDNYAGLEIWWLFQTPTFTKEPQDMILEMILTILSDTSNRSLDYHLHEK
ncbi:Protease 3 [Orchesella cincta]|uniref:Protease 3 n=1 Tax=Orchesella cincta TaxID=48709 RepID=A0A1D2MWN7_ORCCI|nr:Protease 3 [Orchesella cincta]